MHDQNLQDALSKLNWTDQIKPAGRDFLAVNDSNFAGGKSNLYVTQEDLLEITTNSGSTHHKLTITYSNPQKYGAWLNAINRNYVRIYTPQGSKLTTSKASEAKVNNFNELGKTVFNALV